MMAARNRLSIPNLTLAGIVPTLWRDSANVLQYGRIVLKLLLPPWAQWQFLAVPTAAHCLSGSLHRIARQIRIPTCILRLGITQHLTIDRQPQTSATTAKASGVNGLGGFFSMVSSQSARPLSPP
jgi:hypothetical protein